MTSFMRSSILFQNLDAKDEEIIMRAMTARVTEEYEVVIKEGESGNHFYIISEGEYDCYKIV
jgi:CRP-like cAMP-binding protein